MKVGRLFSATSFWNKPLPKDTPTDIASAEIVNTLVAEVNRKQQAGDGPWLATTRSSTPLYRAGPNQARVRVRLDSTGVQGARALARAFAKVPIPANAEPASGSDRHMTVWQPSTDRLWEFFGARRRKDGWHAKWGGAIRRVSKNRGYYTEGAWPGDLAARWDAHGAELSPGAMDELSQEHPELGPVWATALLVAERVTGLPANQAMYDLAPGRRGRLALRLTNWPSIGAVAQAGADVTLVDCLLSPLRQVAVTARRYLFPPSVVLDEFYGLPHDARLHRAALRIVQPPKLLARYAIALWHARTQLPAPTPVNIAAQG